MRRRIRHELGRRPRPAMVCGAVLGLVLTVGLAPRAMAAARPLDAVRIGQSTCLPDAAGTTCTGTFGGHNAWDPTFTYPDGTAGAELATPPTVTVDQTQNVTNQMVHVSWTNFTPSLNDVTGGVGYSPHNTEYPVGIFQCRGTNPQLGPNGFGDPTGDCYSILPFPENSPTSGPINSIITFTDGRGVGSADFQLETAVENSKLSCGDKVPCSLVVVPNWGGTQDRTAPTDISNCDDVVGDTGITTDNHANDSPGFGNGNDLDNNIGLACSWRDRIVVPLSFAPTPTEFCPAADNQFFSEGGAALERAMNQWRPAWCLSNGQTPTFFDFNSTVDEYQARRDFLGNGQALTANTDVAVVNRPPSAGDLTGVSRQFTYAPLAVSGISIVYYLDDQLNAGTPIRDLKLNARLVAKLLTQSYSLTFGLACTTGQTIQTDQCDPGAAGNPVDLFHDPEFLKLNPRYTTSNFEPPGEGDSISINFLPTVLAGNSDLTFELTRWIESDPDARAFLRGQPDPWQMHVNNYYENVPYPIPQFQPLDPGWTGVPAGGNAPNESMQLSWNPVNGLDNVVGTLAGNKSTALTNVGVKCSDPNFGTPGDTVCKGNWVYPHELPEQLGQRALFAVVDQGSAAAFRFPAAQLVNAAGAAVGPNTASMTAAMNDMRTNPDKITQFADFASTDPNAYPLTTVQYAMVPTCELATPAADAIARFLTKVVGSAQQTGTDPGELPPFGGYVPLNDAQRVQTAAAGHAVSAQTCTSPPPDTTVSGQTGSTTAPVGAGPRGGAAGNGAGAGASATGGPSAAGGTPTSNRPTTIPLGLKGLDTNGRQGLALPIALGLGAALALIAGIAYLLNATGLGQDLLARTRRWLGRPPRLEDLGDVE